MSPIRHILAFFAIAIATTALRLSAAAVLPAPTATGIVPNPDFLWPATAGAIAYEIEIAADPAFAKTITPVTRVETPRYVPLRPLAPATLHWRTRPIFPAPVVTPATPPRRGSAPIENRESKIENSSAPWSATRTYRLREPASKIAISATATLAQIHATIAAAPNDAIITFAPGATYRLKPAEGSHLITLTNRADLILDGNDSLFIIETPTAGAIALRDCQRITLRRFRFDYDPLPHTIGTVVSINPAPAAPTPATGAAAPPIQNPESKIQNSIAFRLLPGYPAPDAPHILKSQSFGMILAPAPVAPAHSAGRIKTATPLVVNFPQTKPTRHPDPSSFASASAPAPASPAASSSSAASTPAAPASSASSSPATPAGSPPDLFDIPLVHAGQNKFFAPGDRVIIFARAHAQPLFHADAACADITFDRLVAHAAPGLQFTAIGSTAIKLLSCASIPRDPTRHYAGNADGVHVRANLLGPWIENCTFDSIGDDAIALYNKGMAINNAPAPDTLAIDGTFMHLQPGDTFVIFNPRTGRLHGAPRTVTAVHPAAAPETSTTAGADEASAGKRPDTAGTWRVTFTPALEPAALAGPAALPMGGKDWWQNAQLFNRTRVNAGFVIKNNTIKNIRRYGIISRATDGAITGNTITATSNAGITLINEPHFWGNGLHSERVLIANNTITDTAFDNSSAHAAAIAINLRNLADTSADFAGAAGEKPLAARLHNHIRIENNTITAWRPRAILLRGAADCVIQNNTIAAPAPGSPPDAPAIALDNTQNTRISNNTIAPALPPARRLLITNSETTTTENQHPRTISP